MLKRLMGMNIHTVIRLEVAIGVLESGMSIISWNSHQYRGEEQGATLRTMDSLARPVASSGRRNVLYSRIN